MCKSLSAVGEIPNGFNSIGTSSGRVNNYIVCEIYNFTDETVTVGRVCGSFVFLESVLRIRPIFYY